MIALLAAVAAVAAAPVAGELAARRWRFDGEGIRKAVHAASGCVAAALPLLISYSQIAVVAVAVAAVLAASRRAGQLRCLAGVERSSAGEVWFPLGIAVLALSFPRGVPYAYGTLALGLADAAAALVGARFGRCRLPLARAKSVWGSVVFAVSAALIGFVVGGAPSGVLVAALGLTAAEACATRGTDNFVIPVAAGLFASAW